MSATAGSYRISEPVFAEWAYYNIDYQRLTAFPLDIHCACCETGTCQTSATCIECENMVLAFQQELEKVSSFLHLKSSELEYRIRTSETVLQEISMLDGGEQLVGLSQTEEALGAAMGQLLALARFRRSNFNGFWRQLSRLQAHCHWHYSDVLERLSSSSLFGESLLDTQQLFRVSQLYAQTQGAFINGAAGIGSLPVFPGLNHWRGWVDPAVSAKVRRILHTKLSVASSPEIKMQDAGHNSDNAIYVRSQQGMGQEQEQDQRQLVQLMLQSPPQTHTPSTNNSVSPSGSFCSVRSARAGAESCVLTVYLDGDAMPKYHAGMPAEAPSRDSLSLWWHADKEHRPAFESTVHMCHDVHRGPWFAAAHEKLQVDLEPRYVLPFLHSELNLSKLPLMAPKYYQYNPESSSDDEAEHAVQRREQFQRVQKMQKHIILEDLKPTLMVSEQRTEYWDLEDPHIRIVLRTNVRLAHSDAGTSMQWLEKTLDAANTGAHTDIFGENVPFDIIEVHMDSTTAQQMPDWLAHLFFDSSLVHPVLDFDMYVHGIATLCADRTDYLPYWMVDYCCKAYVCRMSAQPLHPVQTHHTETEYLRDIESQYPTETTLLIPSLAPPTARCQGCTGSPLRYYLTVALLSATVFSVALSIWPYHSQIVVILEELADLIAQWVSRLLNITLF
ncbi:vacuolar transporter chaperone [Kickxella alabastrina]|uniref:Vacuolar transporter chaperone n=1 Tax=Kickxella alabastrina TaxID=61397 RepID=A0ACC1IBB6_9FUNG|nr:vacuolar transporter chaperone [Kickxella alabastrina]